MDALTYDLVRMAKHKAEGSYATQANRRSMLRAMAATLKAGGYTLPEARSIRPKHVEYLIGQWRSDGLSDRTILNRVAVLRWWAEAVNKKSIIARRNETYGLSKGDVGEPRAFRLDEDRVAAIPCPRIQAALHLQSVFGLRREEAIKFRPSVALQADKPDTIHLKASWTKGGRDRSVPITTDEQRAVLAKVVALAGGGSLIPAEKRYIDQLDVYKYQTLKVGVRNAHGLRHQYAQDRYRVLTGGLEPPAKGGVVPSTPEGTRLDLAARRQISLELGHYRLSVTDVYLGRTVAK